jgi:branched-chain amino acid transport system substrate-binding protein
MDRRRFLTTGLSLAGAGTLSAPWVARAQSAPIRIGLMAPLTGVVAAGGREIVDGFTMFWESVGMEVGGRKVELIVEDDASNPDTALQKARRLVEQAKADMLFGNLLANTGLAVANYVKGNGTPYFIPVIAADDLTQRSRVKNVIRAGGYSASQFSRPLADWALKQGYKKVAMISQDYTFGHEQCGGFAQTFTEGGGRIVGQFWHPLNTSDFSPYLGQVASVGADAVFAMETGADSTRLIQQYASFGLKGQIPLLGSQNAADQSVIRTMGSECEGMVTTAHFCEGADLPATQAFVKAYSAKFNKIPSLYAFSHFVGAMWVAKAIGTVRGKVEERETFLDTVLKTDLPESPLGKPVRFDEFGNPIYDVFVRKVVKNAEGKFWNVPVETYSQVSQFWKYDPATYMKQPPYSRDFQGVKKG